MTTQEQQSAAGDELRMLRARAYGPDADIEDDPAALRRLRELEEQGRPEPAGMVDASESLATVPATAIADAEPVPLRVRPGLEEEPASAGNPSANADPTQDDAQSTSSYGGDDATSPRAPWWRRTRTLWIASVAVAAIVSSGVTLAASQAAAGRVAVLNVDRDAELPDGLGTPDGAGLVFEEFHGLLPFVATQDWDEGEPLDCLYVRAVETGPGLSTGGCAGGSFPPTASFVVARTSPDALRERFADGTALQFVARGSQVHVYADEP